MKEYENNTIQNELIQATQHPVVQGFCSHSINAVLLRKYADDPSKDNLDKLNHAFKIYLFALRFSKYLKSLITKGRIDYIRRVKKHEEREPVIYDKPLSAEDETVIGEMLVAVYHGDDLPQVTVVPEVFQEQLNNEWLYDGFSSLSSRRKYVITLAYSASVRDSEIARLLHVTQQAVSKTRASAIQKLKWSFPSYAVPALFQKGG